MDKTLTNLLATDALAQRFGCGLNPKLRQAIEADLRFPAKAAVPRPDPRTMATLTDHDAVRLDDYRPTAERTRA